MKFPAAKNSEVWRYARAFGYVLLVFGGVLIAAPAPTGFERIEIMPYSEFLHAVESGQVVDVVIAENSLKGNLRGASPDSPVKPFLTIPVEDPTLVGRMLAKNVTFRKQSPNLLSGNMISLMLSLLFFYFLLSFIGRRASGGIQGGLLSLTKSKAKVYIEKDIKTTFADVAGVDEAKLELTEIVSFLKDPKHYARLGGHVPKGVLLVGPPGTGKTLMARAIAGEASVPFFSMNGSEFVEMFVGLGAARVRDLFAQTRKNAPCILFIDEIDALGKTRALNLGMTGNDEKEQTLNQLLAEMDGFDTREGIILLAATNRPEILDPALLRAGRFDRQILLGLPDQAGRTEILKVHVKKIKIDEKLDLSHIAALTSGFSGADLANVVNEAALVATRRDGTNVVESDFTEAIERIVAGLEQRKKLINPSEKKRVAYHEMGHTAVALALGTSERVHKVSIIPRGMGALGYTLRRPTEDRYLQDESELIAKIAVLLGGHAAERIVFNKTSTGAADDLAKANDIARAMVTRFGMSPRLGLAVYDRDHSQFLAPEAASKGFHNSSDMSEATARLIDEESRRILDDAHALALGVLKKNMGFVQAGAKELLRIETLDEERLLKMWRDRRETPSIVTKPRQHSAATKALTAH